MRRSTLILSGVAALMAAVVLYTILSGGDGLETEPGDKGVSLPPAVESDTELEEAGSDDASDADGTGEVEEADRTELATVDEPGATATAGLDEASIRFRLVDPENEGVAGVSASLNPEGQHNQEFVMMMRQVGGPNNLEADEAQPSVESGADGSVVIAGVIPGKSYSLAISGDFWAQRNMDISALRPGEVRELGDISISPGVLVSGTVLDGNGRPLPDASVQLSEKNDSNMPDGIMFSGMGGGGRVRFAKTDEKGKFRIPGATPARYTLKAEKTGHIAASSDVELSLARPDHQVELRTGLGGKVQGFVKDDSGRPLADARVVLAPARGFSSYQWTHERVLKEGMEVEEDGSFTLGGVPNAKTHRIFAAAPGFARGRSSAVVPGSKVEIELDQQVILAGMVRDAQGEPVANAAVSATKQGQRERGGVQVESATSDESGRFEFENLSEATYDFSVTAAAGEMAMKDVAVETGMADLQLDLPAGEAMTLRIVNAEGSPVVGASVTLSQHVEDSTSANQLEALRSVRISSGGEIHTSGGQAWSSRRGRTDEAGLVKFIGIEQGEYDARVRGDGYAQIDEIVERDSEEEQLVQLELPLSASVHVIATDPSGIPIPDASIEIARLNTDIKYSRTQTTDNWGRAVFGDLAPGDYTLEEVDGGGNQNYMVNFLSETEEDAGQAAGPELQSFPVEAGNIVDQTVIVAAKSLPTILVTRLGVPVANATVQLTESMGDQMGWFGPSFGGGGGTGTNAQGLAKMPPANPGKYTLKARAAAANPFTELEVTLAPGQQQLTIELATGAISGTINGLAGPVAGARVSLERVAEDGEGSQSQSIGFVSIALASDGEDGEVETIELGNSLSSASTDREGRFQMLDVPPGNYRIKVRAKGYTPYSGESFSIDGSTQSDLGVTQLEAGGSLKGRVIGLPQSGSAGEVRYGSMLQLQQDGTGKTTWGHMRGDGSYTFNDLEPGGYRLIVSHDGESYTSDLIQVRPGDPTTFDYSL